MNIRLGLFFRLWLLLSVVFIVVVGAISFGHVRSEFERASLKEQWKIAGVPMVPVACKEARGKRGYDYTDQLEAALCWYTLPKFSNLYAEYSNLDDDDLIYRLYLKANLPTKPPPAPWTLVLKIIGLAVGAPAIAFGLGIALHYWAFAGFSAPRPNSN